MVMLVGIQGSGKSEIAKQLERKGYFVASNDRYQYGYYAS
jgi:dephospho-CoA kinase